MEALLPQALRQPLHERAPGTPALHPQLRRLAAAAIKWCKAAEPAAPCVIPSVARRESSSVHTAAERLITKAKRGDLHNRREILKVIRRKDVVHRLIEEIGPFFSDRNGG